MAAERDRQWERKGEMEKKREEEGAMAEERGLTISNSEINNKMKQIPIMESEDIALNFLHMVFVYHIGDCLTNSYSVRVNEWMSGWK